MSDPPPMIVVLIALFYAGIIGYCVHVRLWSAAVAIFVYGLAFMLGLIYKRLGER